MLAANPLERIAARLVAAGFPNLSDIRAAMPATPEIARRRRTPMAR
jgi:hypothetical protein